MKAGLIERRVALDVLNGVFKRDRNLDLTPRHVANLSPFERAKALRLSKGVLRHRQKIDHILDRFLKRRPRIESLNILRLATVEHFLWGVKPYAVADQAVSIARLSRRTRAHAGLINTILRKVTLINQDEWGKLSPSRMPEELRGRLNSAYGSHAVEGIERMHEMDPPTDLTFRCVADIEEVASQMGGRIVAPATVRLFNPGQISRLPQYEAGTWWVQDVAASLPVRSLPGLKGLEVIDLCSAPGGKTMQAAAAGARVTALDKSRQRLVMLQKNLERTGLTANIHCQDALTWDGRKQYDVVILDPPCSATGTIRRNPEISCKFSSGMLDDLVGVQERLLDKAISLVVPDGVVLYCVCSLLPEEGENIVTRYVENGLASTKKIDVAESGLNPDWMTREGGVRLRPDYLFEEGGMDGFYMVHLTKPSESRRAVG